MEFKFNATGQKRKALVAAMTELLNTPQKYLGAPTFAYEIGDYRIDKEGVVTGEYSLSLMAALEGKGFEYETKPTFHLITPRGTLLMQEHFDTEEEARKAGYGNYFSHQGRGIFSKRSGEDEKSTMFALVGEPFSKEESTPEIAPEPEADITSIEYPLEGFTPKAIDNLKKMVLAREALIKKALGTDTLTIEICQGEKASNRQGSRIF